MKKSILILGIFVLMALLVLFAGKLLVTFPDDYISYGGLEDGILEFNNNCTITETGYVPAHWIGCLDTNCGGVLINTTEHGCQIFRNDNAGVTCSAKSGAPSCAACSSCAGKGQDTPTDFCSGCTQCACVINQFCTCTPTSTTCGGDIYSQESHTSGVRNFEHNCTDDNFVLSYNTGSLETTTHTCTMNQVYGLGTPENINNEMIFTKSGTGVNNQLIGIVTVTTKKDFKDSDIKVSISYDIGESSSGGGPVNNCAYNNNVIISVNSGDINMFSKSFSSPDGEGNKKGSFNLELKRSYLNSNESVIYIDGISTGNTLIGKGGKLSITASGGMGKVGVSNIKYKVPFSCDFNNQLLGVETFGGNKQVSIYSTRYDVKKFCLAHPAIVMKQGKGSTTTAEIYQKMVYGETLTVPEDEIWTLFYIFDNDGTIPGYCENGYDVINDRCYNMSGITFVCSEGVIDEVTGTCTVNYNTTSVCPDGGRLDMGIAKCIYNPPIHYICSNSDANYYPAVGKCQSTPLANDTCGNKAETYNPISNYCESFPSSYIMCDPFFAYDSNLAKCVRTPLSNGTCEFGGALNTAKTLCIKDVPPSLQCVPGSILKLINNVYTCVYEPKVTNGTANCVQGTFNSSSGNCEIRPNYDYLCLAGSTINTAKNACIINPQKTYVCPEKSTYNNATGFCEVTAELKPQTITDFIINNLTFIIVSGALLVSTMILTFLLIRKTKRRRR